MSSDRCHFNKHVFDALDNHLQCLARLPIPIFKSPGPASGPEAVVHHVTGHESYSRNYGSLLQHLSLSALIVQTLMARGTQRDIERLSWEA